MPPSGGRHGSVAMRIGALLEAHVRTNPRGEVFPVETGFVLRRDPDTVRAPDTAFMAGARLSKGELPAGFLHWIPTLQ